MNYKELLEYHQKYGTSPDDIIKRRNFESIKENVVIAPWWGVEIFDSLNCKIVKKNDILYNVSINNIEFSYICLKNVGAAGIIDKVLALGVTNCKKILFIGSSGSLDKDIKIGDIIVPQYSIVGDGACRYLNKNLEDDFLKKQYPSKSFTNKVIDIIKQQEEVKFHIVPNFSIDTIFAQFAHIDKIKELGCKSIEMETAVFFKASNIIGVEATALFVVSDNTVVNKSLYSGRTKEEDNYRHTVRYEIIPKVIIKLFE